MGEMKIKTVKKQSEDNNKNFINTIKENLNKNPEQKLHNMQNENIISINNKDTNTEKKNYYEHVNKTPIDFDIIDSYINNSYDDFLIDDYETSYSDNCSIKESIKELINNCNNIFNNNLENKITCNFSEDIDLKDPKFIAENLTNEEIVKHGDSNYIDNSIDDENIDVTLNIAIENNGYSPLSYQTSDCKKVNTLNDYNILNEYKDNIIFTKKSKNYYPNCNTSIYVENPFSELCNNYLNEKEINTSILDAQLNNTRKNVDKHFSKIKCNKKKMAKAHLTSYTSFNLYTQKNLCHLLLNNVIIKNRIQIKSNKENSDPAFYFRITKKNMPILHTRIMCGKKEKNKSKQTKINYYANKHFNRFDLSNVENYSDEKVEKVKCNTFKNLKLENNKNGNISNEHKMVKHKKEIINHQNTTKSSLKTNENIIDILYENEKLDNDSIFKIETNIRNDTCFYNSDNNRGSSKQKSVNEDVGNFEKQKSVNEDVSNFERQKIKVSKDKNNKAQNKSNIEIILKKVKLKKCKNMIYIYFYGENNFKICKFKIEPDIVKRSCKMFKNIDVSKKNKCIFTIKKDRILKRFIKISLSNSNNFVNNKNDNNKIIPNLNFQNNTICEITDKIFNVSNFLILFTLIKIKSKIYIFVNEINNIKIKINEIIKHIDKNINEISNIITNLKNVDNIKNTSENIKLINLMVIFLKITNIYSSASEKVRSQYNDFTSIQYNHEIIHSYIFFIKKFDKYIITSVVDIQKFYTKIKEVMKIKQKEKEKKTNLNENISIKQNDKFILSSFYSDLIQCLITHYQKISIFRKILDIYLIELKNFKKYQKEYIYNKLHFITNSKCSYNLLLFSFVIKCKWLSEISIRDICNNFNLNKFDKEKKQYFYFLSKKIKMKILNKFKENNKNDAYNKLKETQFQESLDIFMNNSTNNSINSSFINTCEQSLDIENMSDLFKTNETLDFVKNVRKFLERKNGICKKSKKIIRMDKYKDIKKNDTLSLLKEKKHEPTEKSKNNDKDSTILKFKKELSLNQIKIFKKQIKGKNKNITNMNKLKINKNYLLTSQLNGCNIKDDCKDKTEEDKKENDKPQNNSNNSNIEENFLKDYNDRPISYEEIKMSSNLSEKAKLPKFVQNNKKDKIKIVENIKNIKKIEKKYKHMQEAKNKENFKITLNELRLKKITKRNNIKLLKSRLLKNKKTINVSLCDMKNDTIDNISVNLKINKKNINHETRSKKNSKSNITKIVKYTHLHEVNNSKVSNYDDKIKPSNCENIKQSFNGIIKNNSIDKQPNKLNMPLRNKGRKNSHIFLNKYEKDDIMNKNVNNSEQIKQYSKSEKINSEIMHIINESNRGIQKVNNKYIYMEKNYNKNVENDIKLLENSIYSNIFYDKINEPNFSENNFFFITQMDNTDKKIKPSRNNYNTIVSSQTSCIINSKNKNTESLKNNNLEPNKIIKYKLSDYSQKINKHEKELHLYSFNGAKHENKTVNM
ncbi:hypothetical protein YYC_04394 [Plasmodium yoelii 17X]|uniref:Uncharacterized protein n=1 Tax=Plasmodium yoelii 17X TaxID=1323249 RepID=V7PES2_PLAYE|nr:hypothetical protein YYC_04394 [Plasmodium yoelii 17X]